MSTENHAIIAIVANIVITGSIVSIAITMKTVGRNPEKVQSKSRISARKSSMTAMVKIFFARIDQNEVKLMSMATILTE